LFRSKMSIIMYIVISLAIVGLISQLFTNLTGFLMSILIMLVIAFVVFLIFSHFARNRVGGSSASPEMKKYRQAVKQSRQKYGQTEKNVKKATPKRKDVKQQRKRRRRRRATHLRVIKG